MPASAERWGYQEKVRVLVHGHRIVSITIELTKASGRGLRVLEDAVNLELETSSNVHRSLDLYFPGQGMRDMITCTMILHVCVDFVLALWFSQCLLSSLAHPLTLARSTSIYRMQCNASLTHTLPFVQYPPFQSWESCD